MMFSKVLTTFAVASLTTTRAFMPTAAPLARTFVSKTPLFMSEESKVGSVKWFNTQKGFGFIIPEDGSTDVFVHQTEIRSEGFRSLADGEKVEFKVIKDQNGRLKAIDVTGPGGAEVQGAPYQARSGGYDDEGY